MTTVYGYDYYPGIIDYRRLKCLRKSIRSDVNKRSRHVDDGCSSFPCCCCCAGGELPTADMFHSACSILSYSSRGGFTATGDGLLATTTKTPAAAAAV